MPKEPDFIDIIQEAVFGPPAAAGVVRRPTAQVTPDAHVITPGGSWKPPNPYPSVLVGQAKEAGSAPVSFTRPPIKIKPIRRLPEPTKPFGAVDIPEMRDGGYVPPTPGGQVVRLGEGGEGEFVVPESQVEGRSVLERLPKWKTFSEEKKKKLRAAWVAMSPDARARITDKLGAPGGDLANLDPATQDRVRRQREILANQAGEEGRREAALRQTQTPTGEFQGHQGQQMSPEADAAAEAGAGGLAAMAASAPAMGAAGGAMTRLPGLLGRGAQAALSPAGMATIAGGGELARSGNPGSALGAAGGALLLGKTPRGAGALRAIAKKLGRRPAAAAATAAPAATGAVAAPVAGEAPAPSVVRAVAARLRPPVPGVQSATSTSWSAKPRVVGGPSSSGGPTTTSGVKARPPGQTLGVAPNAPGVSGGARRAQQAARAADVPPGVPPGAGAAPSQPPTAWRPTTGPPRTGLYGVPQGSGAQTPIGGGTLAGWTGKRPGGGAAPLQTGVQKLSGKMASVRDPLVKSMASDVARLKPEGLSVNQIASHLTERYGGQVDGLTEYQARKFVKIVLEGMR